LTFPTDVVYYNSNKDRGKTRMFWFYDVGRSQIIPITTPEKVE